MRAHFIRGAEPKDSMEIGVDAKVYKFLKTLAGDYQLNPDDENYLGFVNVYADGFYDGVEREGFEIFVNTWPRYKSLMNRFGLTIEEEKPDLEETVFKPSYGIDD